MSIDILSVVLLYRKVRSWIVLSGLLVLDRLPGLPASKTSSSRQTHIPPVHQAAPHLISSLVAYRVWPLYTFKTRRLPDVTITERSVLGFPVSNDYHSHSPYSHRPSTTSYRRDATYTICIYIYIYG